MVIFFLFLGLGVLALYFLSRINKLEQKIKKLEFQNLVSAATKTPLSTEHLVSKAPLPPSAISPLTIPSPANVSKDVPKQEQNLEFKLGSKFFTGIGAVAVLFGIGFFLRYAFEQNIITEAMRVLLGVIAGLILIGAGEYLRKKYDQYGQILQGTGIGVLYLSLFAAYSFYTLVTQPTAFVGMIIVTLGAVFLAIRANSIYLAGVGQFGAYITPLLLGLPKENPHQFFLYLILLNVGVLLIALWKTWRALTIGSLIATCILYVIWHTGSYNTGLWELSMVYLTINYLIFLSVNIYRYFIQKHKSDENDLALVVLNPMFYFVAGYAVMHPVNSEWVGWFAFALSIIYFAIGHLISRDNSDAKIFHFGVGSILLLVGIPIEFNQSWITIGWAAEAMFLMYYGLVKRWKGLQYLAHVIFMVASMRFVLFDLQNVNGGVVVNGRALIFIVIAGLLSLAAYLHYRQDQTQTDPSQPNKQVDKSFEVLVIQAHVIAIFWTGFEITKFANSELLGVVWAGLASLLLWIGFVTKNTDLRVLSYSTALLAFLRVVMFDSEVVIATHESVLNYRVLAFVGTALIFSLMLNLINSKRAELREDEIRIMPVAMFMGVNLLLLWILSLEITSYFDKQLIGLDPDNINRIMNSKRAALSVAWSLYAVVMLALGIAWKSTIARLFAIGLFSIVIFKVFLYDTANLSNFSRFVSFITLGVILLLAGYWYNRYKDRIAEFIQIK